MLTCGNYSGPLCNTPVAIPPNQDPNMRMEQHIEKECSVTTGKRSKQGGMPVCAKGKCGKVLFAPIKCNVSECQCCMGVDHNLRLFLAMGLEL